MNFTFDEYREIIDLLHEHQYTIKKYSIEHFAGKEVILRHDIDMSIDKALEFAYFEHSLGVQSTYFVLLTSPLYNVFRKENTAKLKEIFNLGHSIGLHFDETNYLLSNDEEIKRSILNEKSILENILSGINIKAVSMHMPSKRTLEANLYFDGKLINSYSNLFFKNYKYVPDSEMRWRENVKDVITSGNYNKLHILTHPIWYDEGIKSKEEKIRIFLLKDKEETYEEVSIIVPGINEKISITDF